MSPLVDHREEQPPRRRILLRFFLPLLVLAAAGLIAAWMLSHPPAARRPPPPAKSTLAEVTTIRFGKHPVALRAMGKVSAAQELDLRPRIKGEVRFLSKDLVPGGLVRAGDLLLRIDPRDYRLAVRQAESALAQARANLTVEEGKGVVARKEYEVLGQSVKKDDLELVLRQPQLATARAAVEAAQAARDRARLDLERTTIRAPFNAVVQTRSVDLGAHVTELSSLARLIGTDLFWVQLLVPVDQLRWVRVPSATSPEGSRVRIFDAAAWGNDRSREGRVLRLAPDLEEKGRMARLIVGVEDPLARLEAHAGEPRLLIGSYVEAAIAGGELPRAAVLSRRLLRDGDKVWVYADGRLAIRAVTIAHRDPREVLVTSGIEEGERIVTSDLSTPVQGMRLELAAPARKPAPSRAP